MRWLALAVLLTLLVPLAAAHGDAPSWSGAWTLEPGQTVAVERPVHWHRVLGTLQADGDVVLLAGGEVVAGPGRDLTIDHLVQCCDAVWTDYGFAVRNVDDVPMEVRVELAFLHDNLAVIVDDAEAGAWWQTLLLVGLLVGIPAWRVRQGPVDAAGTRDWLRTSRILHAAAWVVGGLLAVIGMARFGTGPLVGSIAATAPFPSSVGGFFNTHSLVMLGLMALWGAAYGFWAGARRRSRILLRVDGYAFAAGPLVVGGLMLAEFGGGWIPVVLGLVPTLAILADTLARAPAPTPGSAS